MPPFNPEDMKKIQMLITKAQPTLAELFTLFRQLNVSVFEIVVMPTMDRILWKNPANLPITRMADIPPLPPEAEKPIPSTYFHIEPGGDIEEEGVV